MKKTLLLLSLSCLCSLTFAQNKTAAEKLVNEGVAYHDKGDYEGAISRYDKALELDKNNLLALAEKSFSLLSMQKYKEAIKCCQKAIDTHPGDPSLKTVYVTYGNVYDALKKTDKSIEVYDEGIKQFPDFYLLYFNKAITLLSVKKEDEARASFQKAVRLNPKHASSHNAIARLADKNKEVIPAVLAYGRFLAVEPQSERAKENLRSLQKLLQPNVEKTGEQSININLNGNLLASTTPDGKPKENNFSTVYLLLSLKGAADMDKKDQPKTDVDLFMYRIETICTALKESKKDNFGFFWDVYAPYFIEMKEKNFVEMYAHVAFVSGENPDVLAWLKAHEKEMEQFFKWSEAFK
jgi:tetratricopeptide (TPR) repeat protein